MLVKRFQKLFRWIKAHSHMGKAIQLLRSSKKENSNEDIEEAISLLSRARLEFAELRSEPAYSIATFHLAEAMTLNSNRDRSKNIEQGIAVFEELLVNAIQNENVDLQITSYVNIGRSYYQLSKERTAEDRLNALDGAIGCMQKILKISGPENRREQWQAAMMLLVVYLFTRHQFEEDDELLKQIIALLEKLLSDLRDPEKKEFSGPAHHLLGKAYAELKDANIGENSEVAIDHLQKALKHEFFPEMSSETADIFITLAKAQILRARGSRKYKFELAQEYIDKTERILNVINDPYEWERLYEVKRRVLLSGMLDPHPTVDSKNVKEAIRITEDQPDQIILDHTELERWEKERLRFEMQLLHYSFGLLEMMMEVLKDVSEDKRRRYFREIINYDFTNINDELRSVHPELFETLEKKIEGFQRMVQSVLTLLNKEQHSSEWAKHHLSLAGIYIFRSGLGSAKTEAGRLQEQAIYHFKQALEVILELKNSFYLGFISRISGFPILFVNRRWEEAEQLFRVALEAQEQTYRLSLSEKGKENTLEEVGNPLFGLSSAQAYVLARRGKITEAVEILEKWRGRRISEELRRDPRNLKTAEIGDYKEYCKIVDQIDALETEQRSDFARGFAVIVEELKSAHERLDDVIARIRLTHPDFMLELSFDDIRQAASENKPLAYVLSTEAGSLVLLISDKAEPLALWEDDFTKGQLFSVLAGSDMNGAIEESIANSRARLASEILPSCAGLVGKLFDELEKQKANGVVLIACGTLAMLPLHAVEVEGKGCLIDRFDVHYAPSAHTILLAKRNLAQNRRILPGFLGIGDPDRTLKNAALEVKVINGFFKAIGKSKPLIYEQATLENLHKNTEDVTHLHFSCHGELGDTNTLDSCLVLANNEKLTLRNLLDDSRFNFLKDSRLVVLSACWSSSIDITTNPEESTGITLGFLSAGVPGVIGTLWSVDDLSTALLMIMFYKKHVRDGFEPAAALRAVQRWLRDATDEQIEELSKRYLDLSESLPGFNTREGVYRSEPPTAESRCRHANPYFWAGFVLIGV